MIYQWGYRKRRRIGQTDVEAQDFWQKIEEVCILVISNKRFNPEATKKKFMDESVAEPDIINTYEMLNRAHPTRHLGNLEAKVVLVMLANFNKTVDELETDTDRWFFALKDERMATGKLKINPFKEVLDIKKAASESGALREFYAGLHTGNIGRDILTEYEEKLQETNERLARTFAEGEAKGEQRTKREAIARMRSLGIEDSIICQYLGISMSQLGDLTDLL